MRSPPRARLSEAGVNSFLSKPVQLSELMAAIAQYLRLEWESGQDAGR